MNRRFLDRIIRNIRGGCWLIENKAAKSADRNWFFTDAKRSGIGMRIILVRERRSIDNGV